MNLSPQKAALIRDMLLAGLGIRETARFARVSIDAVRRHRDKLTPDAKLFGQANERMFRVKENNVARKPSVSRRGKGACSN